MSNLPPSFAKHLRSLSQPRRKPEPGGGLEAALRKAKEHHDRGEIKQAETLCMAILSKDPGNAQALLLAGSLAHGIDDVGLALEFYRRAVERQPNSAHMNIVIASAYAEAKEYDKAILHFQRALKLKGETVPTLGALGRAYTAAGMPEQALPLFDRALKLQSDHPALRYDHATALIALGRMDEAAKLLRESIERGYRVSACYRALVDTRKFVDGQGELDEILSCLNVTGRARRETVELNHAAGKIFNDIGRFEQAIDHFQASKIAAGHGFDIDTFRLRVDNLIASFTPDLIKAKSDLGNESELPVFIVGMPRSGTTLTEQICASHPAVYGAGELAKLGMVAHSAGYVQAPNGSILKTPQALTHDEARAMAAEYLGFLKSRSPSAARIVDKMPHNFQYVGLIALLFPNAKVIHCTRDPIDNSISCFFNTFNDKHGYNTDLRTLGLYYREYHRLMQHWYKLLPGRIYQCNYETMIADQEAESRRLIDFLGLPWDEACLRFYETDRAVTTPSRWQVRQPIYKSSVKRWKKYEHRIQPLIEALGDLAVV